LIPAAPNSITCMSFGSEMILLFGTEDQKQRYLRSVCQGAKIGAVAVTEPDAGSDVLNVSTKAVEQDGGYLINGSKMFISNGDIADFLLSRCGLTNPDAASKTARHSVIVIDGDSPGIERNKIHGKTGDQSHDTAEINFSNVWVPKENLIGEEGKGFECFMAFSTGPGPILLPRAWVWPRAPLEMALKHTRKRKVFGKPLSESELVQDENWQRCNMD